MTTTITFTNGSSVQLYSAFGNTTVSSEYLMRKEQGNRHNGIVHAYFGYKVADMEAYIKKAADKQVERLSKISEKFRGLLEQELSYELEELL